MPDDVKGIVLGPGEGLSVANPVGGSITFKLRGHETQGALLALETVAAPGEGPPMHTHADEDEFPYVLEGRFQFRLEDEISEGPAGMERFFERFAAHAGAPTAPEAFRTLGGEVGMTVVGPLGGSA